MSKRLPSLTAKEVARILQRAGFVQVRTSGSHARFVHKTDPTRKTTIPLHTGDLPKGTLREILKQAGLSREDL